MHLVLGHVARGFLSESSCEMGDCRLDEAIPTSLRLVSMNSLCRCARKPVRILADVNAIIDAAPLSLQCVEAI